MTVATVVDRKANEVIVTSMLVFGEVCIWRESGVCGRAVDSTLVRLALTRL